MANWQWVVVPSTIGVVTRYRVQRADGGESRGTWDYREEAERLADLLNNEDEEGK